MREMRLLCGADERELAAEMFNFESGAKKMGINFERLPPPYAPYPVADIAPMTKKGVPFQIHYRPVLGIVYYTHPANGSVDAMVRRVIDLLDSVGFEHLSAYRATAATAMAILRCKKNIAPMTMFDSSRHGISTLREYSSLREHSSLREYSQGGAIPARLVRCCYYEGSPPPCRSYYAAFTWVFLPIDTVFKIAPPDGNFDKDLTEDVLNASISGIVHDSLHLLREGIARDCLSLTIQDFKVDIHEIEANIQKLCGPLTSGALIYDQGSFHFTSRWSGRSKPKLSTLLPSHVWPTTALQCTLCDTPLDGEAMIVRGALPPAARFHQAWYQAAPSTPGWKLNGGYDIVLCKECYIPQCCVTHMAATAYRCEVPLSQAELCARIPQYNSLTPLLEGKASKLEGVEGAFLVEHRTGSYILVGASKGEHPALAYEAIATHKGPVISRLNILEKIINQ